MQTLTANARAESQTDVLICGAGPTGLVLALRLVRAGVRVRIIDANTEQGTTSRALVVHARTLEFYRQMGLSEDFVKEGIEFTSVNLWVRARRVARAEFDELGRGLSAFPSMLVVPQDRHERFLIERLRRAGVEVERGTKLVDFDQDSESVRARLEDADGVQSVCTARYLAGADGARSKTREIIDAGFGGKTYSHVFFVADVEATGPVMNDELHIALDESDVLGVFPLMGGRTARLLGTVRTLDEYDGSRLTFDDVSQRIVDGLGIKVERINWFSTYRVHHRVAGRFQSGRAFLLGDAAHIHSPVGAQGMNTGIGDAVNLAWKLADVLKGRAPVKLLDSYEPERIAFARKLVATTDRAFVFATSAGRFARFVRTRVLPLILPTLVRFEAVRKFQFKTLSQTMIHYRDSALSRGRVGVVRGGDRLPWVEFAGTDNFAALDGLAWRVHVYGTPSAELESECQRLGIELSAFPWNPAMGKVGLERDAFYLLRPDGHVALVDDGTNPASLARYASEHMLARTQQRELSSSR